MTIDLRDDVRRTLASHAGEVEVPAIDQLAFQEHVRSARRNKRRARISWVAAGTGIAAAGVAGVMVATNLVAGSDQLTATDGPPVFAAAGSPTPPVLLLDDSTVKLVEDGSTYTANLDMGRLGAEDAYRTKDGLFIVDGRSRPLAVPIRLASGAEPLEVSEPTRLAHAVDNLAISADGQTGAWFALDQGTVEFVFYDFAKDKEVFSRPVDSDGVVETIVAVSRDSALVESGDELQEWTSDGKFPLGFNPSPYATPISSNAGIVAMGRADMSGTDVFADSGVALQKLATVPVASGEISPKGDNVVGFTAYAVDGPHTPDQDPRYLELWSADGTRRSSFAGLPTTVYEFAWLDNDTIALTGGPGEGTWPGRLDTYTCELADLTCTKIADDETGPDDRLPMLASGRGL